MLFKINKILVCSDLGTSSEMVLRNARRIQEIVGGKMDLLHVADSSSLVQQEKISEQVASVEVLVNLVFRVGDPYHQIKEQLNSCSYDLVIIGKKNQSSLKAMLLGSVARKVLSNVNVATLVIDEEISFSSMAVLLDSSGSMGWMITTSLDFFRSFKFHKIEFFSLVEENVFENKQRIQEEIDYFLHPREKASLYVEVFHETQVAQHLYEIMRERNINVALMKRNRGKNLKKIFLGSQTLKMLELSPMNLLVLPV